jgi:hypothetical protein
MGRDLYELRNLAFGAYWLNQGDVVRATRDRPNEPPEIVVRASGHRTIRVVFAEGLDENVVRDYLFALQHLGVGIEHGYASLCALDLPPEIDRAVLCRALEAWRASDLLDYETCEARRTGSFDLLRHPMHAAPRALR